MLIPVAIWQPNLGGKLFNRGHKKFPDVFHLKEDKEDDEDESHDLDIVEETVVKERLS